MVVQVDPFLYPIPDGFLKDPEVRAWYEYDNRWKHDIWLRTGGGDDAIAESQIGELYEPGIQTSNVDELAEELEVSQEMAVQAPVSEVLEVITANANFTTTGNQILICTNTAAITITLNANPDDGEQVHIKRQNAGGVKVVGAIDGATTKTIGVRYSSPHLIYTIDANEWSII